jgi:DNA sulfur modification protein DndD
VRIERITLHNYRQFRDSEIRFDKGEHDLHIFIGRNGTGKTNILNAINWCLYNEEPHLSKDSQQLPLVNLKAVDSAKDGETVQVEVSITTAVDTGEYIVFSRKAEYRIYQQPKSKLPVLQRLPEATALLADTAGNTRVLAGEDAKSYVDRFIPKHIREYYLFDGERLDNYFKETAENVVHAVFEISQIALLQRTEAHLVEVLKDFQKEAGRLSPEIESKESEMQVAEQALADIVGKIDGCKKQIREAKDGMKACDDALRGAPNLEDLERRRAELKDSKSKKEQALAAKMRARRDALFEYGRLIPLIPSIRCTLALIRAKEERKEIPPPTDISLLESILKSGTCQVCGRDLDDQARAEVSALLEGIRLSSGIGKMLWDTNPQLVSVLNKVQTFRSVADGLAADIGAIEADLGQIQAGLNGIDAQMIGWPVEATKARYQQRSAWERVRDEEQLKLGGLEEERRRCETRRDLAKKAWETELKKLGKADELGKQIKFVTEALQVVLATVIEIMEGTRKKVQEETNAFFLSLIWKKNTFESIQIDSDYRMNLMHQMGYDCLGSIGAAERELLALSFTLALHRVSGFDSPILIDTPVARISDVQRENFAKVLGDLSAHKQVILLFTPSEYSADLQPVLEPIKKTKCELRMSSDEKETIVEVS